MTWSGSTTERISLANLQPIDDEERLDRSK
jgi:hypothetical protein